MLLRGCCGIPTEAFIAQNTWLCRSNRTKEEERDVLRGDAFCDDAFREDILSVRSRYLVGDSSCWCAAAAEFPVAVCSIYRAEHMAVQEQSYERGGTFPCSFCRFSRLTVERKRVVSTKYEVVAKTRKSPYNLESRVRARMTTNETFRRRRERE